MKFKTLFIPFAAVIIFSGCSNTGSAIQDSIATAEASDWWTRPVSFEEFWSIQSESNYDYKMENLNCSDLQHGKWFGVELSGDTGLCSKLSGSSSGVTKKKFYGIFVVFTKDVRRPAAGAAQNIPCFADVVLTYLELKKE